VSAPRSDETPSPVSAPSDGQNQPEILHPRPGTGITCSGCPAQWTGASRAHCSGCHRTFSGATLFDAHRSPRGPRGTCLDPATLTVTDGSPRMRLRDGIWAGPEMDEAAKARRFGGMR
jgi:hypothetical protein